MIYKIVKYNMKGATLYTREEMPFLTEIDGKFYEEDGTEAYKNNSLFEYTSNPNKGAYSAKDERLPYYADVTEDVPAYLKIHAKTFYHCQLMTEKHGNYLQFWHEETKQVLRIAINSNYYTPTVAKIKKVATLTNKNKENGKLANRNSKQCF
jgi:hypothetical protein